jgi:transcriptional regulator of acetoin/glycerol metabolism
MEQREVRAAWEKFVEHGALSADLRSAVAASWQRSKNHMVTIDRAQAPLVADAEPLPRNNPETADRVDEQMDKLAAEIVAQPRYSLATYLDGRKNAKSEARRIRYSGDGLLS